MSKEVTYHRSEYAGDFHEHIHIHRHSDGNNSPWEYSVIVMGPEGGQNLTTLRFQDRCVERCTDINGLTNEVLLAIVQDRLEQFQLGQFPCVENLGAIRHVKLALMELHHRTGVRAALRSDDMSDVPVNEAHASKQRVSRTDTHLVFSVPGLLHEEIPLKSLEAWGGWPRVEHAAKLLVNAGKPLLPEEMTVIESCAVGRGGKSGFAEFTQAYRSHVLS